MMVQPAVDPWPLVSVILPVFNGEPYLRDAIDSVLMQDYPNFELIIIDDGSHDNSWATICSIDDGRVRSYRQPNAGLPTTLNRGIELSGGELVARMDQDDHCHPERLRQQARFLNGHPEIGVVGCSYRVIDTHGRLLGTRYQLCSPVQVRRHLYSGNPFCHGSVTYRKSTVLAAGSYDPTALIEDYDLWTRAACLTQMANLPDALYDYRVNVSTSMVAVNQSRYAVETESIRQQMWERNDPPFLQGLIAEKRLLRSGPLVRHGSHNRTRRQLNVMVGLSIASVFFKRSNSRRASQEWIGLALMNLDRPAQVTRVLRHAAGLLSRQYAGERSG
ncbi:MAG: glycosyltransferase [Anaerolineae bacterium]|nr:glycosyltransferase [Anaerolineae bacterium]